MMKSNQLPTAPKNPNLQPIELPLKSLIRLAWSMEIGLKAGRDWLSVLHWLSENDTDAKLKLYLKELSAKLRVDVVAVVLKEEQKKFEKNLLARVFFEILLQSQKGSQQLIPLFQMYAQVASAIDKVKRQEKSLLFIPKFQMWIGLVIAVFFTAIFPLWMGDSFPTFLSMGMYTQFSFGVFFLGLGFWSMNALCKRPARLLAPTLNLSFFFFFMAIFVESGLEVSSAWKRALDLIPFPPEMKAKLDRPSLQTETIEIFLKELEKTLPEPWPEILAGLGWTRNSGIGLPEFLKNSALRESDRLLYQWEDEIRRLTLVTLVPLALFIMLPTLYLLLGPQLMVVMQ